MAQLPASYPTIPYLGLIPGGLYHGLMIRINGEMLHHDRFNVDIKTGPVIHPSDDVNLHMSVRPNENAIVRNGMIRQSWGTEERHGGCPIGYGTQFEILILAETDQFKIAVNGRHFCEFRHRMPLSSARFINVSGQVKISSIKLEGDPNTVTITPSAPSAPMLPTMTTSMPSYQPAQVYQPPHLPHQPGYQPPPYPTQQPLYPTQQPPYPVQTSPYAALSSSISAMPSNQPTYPSGQYFPPQQTYYNQQNLSSQPYQEYPSYHTYTTTQYYTPTKNNNNSNMGSTALKYAAGIGAAGLGAYAITKIFEDSDSD